MGLDGKGLYQTSASLMIANLLSQDVLSGVIDVLRAVHDVLGEFPTELQHMGGLILHMVQ